MCIIDYRQSSIGIRYDATETTNLIRGLRGGKVSRICRLRSRVT